MKEKLWLTGDEPNFDLFGSFGLDFFRDDELLLTETDLTEQTEIGQLNDEDNENFIPENRNRIEANCKITIFLEWNNKPLIRWFSI